MDLGSIILIKRRRLGLSLRDLSEKSDISATYISMIERGLVIPSGRAAGKILDALGFDDIDREHIIVSCGIIPSDIVDIIKNNPEKMLKIVREIALLEDGYIDRIIDYIDYGVWRDEGEKKERQKWSG